MTNWSNALLDGQKPVARGAGVLATPWITSGSLSLTVQSPVAVSNSSFAYLLPAQSVITFVAQVVSNSPPVLQPITDQTRNPGVWLTVTNVASDPDAGQVLTFSILQGPTGSTLDPGTGVFSWRPPVSAANSINPVAVTECTDQDRVRPGLDFALQGIGSPSDDPLDVVPEIVCGVSNTRILGRVQAYGRNLPRVGEPEAARFGILRDVRCVSQAWCR